MAAESFMYIKTTLIRPLATFSQREKEFNN